MSKRFRKSFGTNPLFQNISFTVSEGDRIGLIGPKRVRQVHAGCGCWPVTSSRTKAIYRGPQAPARLTYVEQDSAFDPEATVRSVVESALVRSAVPDSERGTRFAETLGRAGFEGPWSVRYFPFLEAGRSGLAIVESVGPGTGYSSAGRADEPILDLGRNRVASKECWSKLHSRAW